MLDDAARQALVERLKQHGWDQGSLIDWRVDLYLASTDESLTPEAEATAKGEGPFSLVFEIKKKGSQMVLISQRCDIVNPDEPLVEAIPVQQWPDTKPLPGLNSSRYYVLDADARLIADATRRLVFEKTLLPAEEARQLCANEVERRSFVQWCARRYSRVAFADDFVATVGYALEDALKKEGKKDPEARKALHSWRVAETQSSSADPIDVSFLVVFDEEHGAAKSVPAFVSSVLATAQAQLPKFQEKAVKRLESVGSSASVRKHRIVRAEPVEMSKVSLRDLRAFPSFNLEHMTYDGSEALGVEPHEEALA